MEQGGVGGDAEKTGGAAQGVGGRGREGGRGEGEREGPRDCYPILWLAAPNACVFFSLRK